MAVAELGFKVDSSGVRTAVTDLDRLDVSAGRVEKSSNKMGAAFGGAVGKMIAMAAAAVSFAKITGTLAEFDSSMSKLGAVTRATTSELEAMRDIARDLGSSTEFSAKQAADGLTFLGMAGFSAAEGMAAIPAVLDLATASGMGLAGAADTASNIMSGFSIEAQNAGKVADVLAAASSRANTTVAQLGSAMSTVAPIASSLGIDLDDTAAAIGVLSDAGIQGERAGTALRGVMAALAGPTSQATDALAKYDLTAKDVNPATKDMADIFELLQSRGLSTADAMTIFGREVASGALVLAGASGRLREFGAELGMVDGEAKRMADTMRDNLGGDMQGLVSAVEGLIIAMGDAGLTAAIRAVVQALTEGIRFFSMLLENVEAVQGVAISAATALGVVLAPAMYAAATSVFAVVTSLAFLKTALIATGIGAIIVAVGLLIGEFIKLVERTGSVGNAFKLLGEVASGVWRGITTSAQAIPPALAAIWASVQSSFMAMLSAMSERWSDFLANLSAGLSGLPAMSAVADSLSAASANAFANMSEFDAKAQSYAANASALKKEASDLATKGFDVAADAAGRLSAAVIESNNAINNTPDIPMVGDVPQTVMPDGAAIGGGGGGASSAAVDQYKADLDALTDSLRTERETLAAWYAESDALLNDRRAMELLGAQGHNDAKLALEAEYSARLVEIKQQEADMVKSAASGMYGELSTLLSTFGAKSKSAAIAALAVNTALRVSEVIQNTAAASVRALAELGPIAGPPAAAKIMAFGKVQAGLVLANAALSAGGSRGGSGGGSSASAPSAGGGASTSSPQQVIVQLSGTMSAVVAPMMDEIVKGIQKRSDDGEYIIAGFTTA